VRPEICDPTLPPPKTILPRLSPATLPCAPNTTLHCAHEDAASSPDFRTTPVRTMTNHPYQARPGVLELRSHSHDPPRNIDITTVTSASMSSLSLADLPSPRAGEVPPALSPLDQLALQGRLLAKRFEQQDKTGRRLSRLAPLTIQNEFGNRAGYFSSLSSTVNSPEDEAGPISLPKLEASPRQHVSEKHRSVYPQLGGDEPPFSQPPSSRTPLDTIGEGPASPPRGYFDIPRSHSPDAVEPRIGGLREATPVSPHVPAPTSQLYLSPRRKPSSDSQSRSRSRSNLLPPPSSSSQRSPAPSPSIRSVPGDGSSDVEDLSLSGSYDSLRHNRNLSPSSSLSRSHSPFTPATGPSMPRSPSVSSDYSATGSQLPRPAYNFSRPISRQSARPSVDLRPSMDGSSRQHSQESVYMRPSLDSQPARQGSADNHNMAYLDDTVHTPVSMASEDFRRSSDFTSHPAPSYTYTKFSLPRGRKVDRRSVGIEDFFKSQITWDQDQSAQSNRPTQQRPPSPESPPRSFESARSQQGLAAARGASFDQGAPSLTSSNSTIRARPAGSKETTAQEHCDIGLELHEAGKLLKSTYHLRLAARSGLPEAMFWYGLACRHGWGMRENKAEALQWLRRAVDSGQLEVAEDEDHNKHREPTDALKKKQHRAQYAVAIYELGKCYMNGWGATQDKALALRCYEIAGNWGDADALVEAGYCYAEAVGCKKDMKKAAKFYRAAEARGVSMVGNSWIYKEKYMDDGTSTVDARSVRSGRSAKKDASEKKSRDKSRTRTMFGRKKSYTTTST
jgi:TPR repeat protein